MNEFWSRLSLECWVPGNVKVLAPNLLERIILLLDATLSSGFFGLTKFLLKLFLVKNLSQEYISWHNLKSQWMGPGLA